MTAVAASPMLRWSSVRDCPRKAVYEATGAPARERTQREERILFRGKTLGRDFADMLAAQLGEDAIERERKVIWPLGVGHIDVFVKETRTVIEVLSSAHASAEYAHSKLIQAVGYTLHDPEAENACLVILNPSDYSEERAIVTPSSPQWDVLVAEVEARVAQVLAWRDGDGVPARVCSKPSDARGHFCQHADHCFEGWTPEPLPVVDTDQARHAVSRFAAAKEQERELKVRLAEAETRRREAQQAVADLELPAGDSLVGGFKLRRIHYKGRESFKLPLAREDSRFDPALLAEFVTVGEPYDVFHADRMSGEPATVEDFGDEAPF